MTALLVSEVFPPRIGGSSRMLWEVYRRFRPGDVVIAAGEHPRQEEFDRTHDLRITRLPLTFPTWGIASLKGLRSYWRALRLLQRLTVSARISRLHCGKCLPEGLLAWLLKRKTGLPYVCFVYGEEMNLASTSRELYWLTRRALFGAEFVIAISRNTERILRDEWRLDPDRIRVLHPGVDTERFVPAPRDEIVRERFGWTQRRVVLTVGRMQKRKGHDRMIRALTAIRQAVPDILYAIVGDGEERPFLSDLVAREGLTKHVQFLGEVNDALLVECYQQCDLFVLPNREVAKDIEGFGMVLLEAQACGKPVIAGASGGTAETMKIPETGYVVDCDKPHELARRVCDLLADEDRLARMGHAARDWVVEHFDWAALSRQARSLLQTEKPPDRKGEVHVEQLAACASATLPDGRG